MLLRLLVLERLLELERLLDSNTGATANAADAASAASAARTASTHGHSAARLAKQRVVLLLLLLLELELKLELMVVVVELLVRRRRVIGTAAATQRWRAGRTLVRRRNAQRTQTGRYRVDGPETLRLRVERFHDLCDINLLRYNTTSVFD